MPFVTPLMSEATYLQLERVQRGAARVATHWPTKTNTTIIYDQLGLEPVRDRAWRLTDNYMSRALVHNDLIKTLTMTYLIAEPLNEGSHIKPSNRPRQTILGSIKSRPSMQCGPTISSLVPQPVSTFI